MDIVLYSIPVFFLLIFIEIIYGRKTGKNYYRINDTIGSLGTGILSQLVGIFTGGITVASYYFISENFSIFVLPENLLVSVFAFFFYDLCYYSYHRFSHEVNIGWASHVVHHSSEDYNLGTALRQTGTSFYLNWMFYIPMALAGIPIETFLFVGALNLVYQFWVHTRHVPKLGWLEWIFITPSNHRVHHAQNPVYIDKNHGGVFIIWDRLFGTFQEELEDEPVIYGIRKPLQSWNPVWANFAYYKQLVDDARHASRWSDKLTIWFRRTGWRPADVEREYPLQKTDLEHFSKFETGLSRIQSQYALLAFFWIIALSLSVLIFFSQLPDWLLLSSSLVVAFSLYSLSVYLLHESNSKYLEQLRLLLMGMAVFAIADSLEVELHYTLLVVILFLVSSLFFLWDSIRQDSRSSP